MIPQGTSLFKHYTDIVLLPLHPSDLTSCNTEKKKKIKSSRCRSYSCFATLEYRTFSRREFLTETTFVLLPANSVACLPFPFFFFFLFCHFLMFHNVPPNVKGNTKKQCLKEEKKKRQGKKNHFFLHYLIFFFFFFCLVFAAIDKKLHRHVIMKEMWLHHFSLFVLNAHLHIQAQH